MSEEQLKAFIAKIQQDDSLQQQLKVAADDDEVIAIALKAGCNINLEDIESLDRELSEEELETIAAGYPAANDIIGKNLGRVTASLADKKCTDGLGEALSRKPRSSGPNWGNFTGKVPKTGCFASL